MKPLHPATEAILAFFEFEHLPPHLRDISAPFHDLAWEMAGRLDGAELTAGLRKLLEAKDCMVRAALDLPASTQGVPVDVTQSHDPFAPEGTPPAEAAADAEFVLVTFQTVDAVEQLHAYGLAEQAAAQAAGQALATPELGFMVLGLEAFPNPDPQADAAGGDHAILYTYDPTASPQCHAYGDHEGQPWSDQDAAESAGLTLSGEAPVAGPNPNLQFHVLELEPLPAAKAQEPAPDPTPPAESAGPTEPGSDSPTSDEGPEAVAPAEPEPAPVTDITPTEEAPDVPAA